MSTLASATQNSPAEEIGAITPGDWNAVKDFIDAVARVQNQNQFKRSLEEWQVAVRQFRKVELQQMVLREPDETDLRFHGTCLHPLLAMGEALKLWYRNSDAAALADVQIRHDDLCAAVEDLKLGLREWHHSLPPQELKRLQDIIFGAAA